MTTTSTPPAVLTGAEPQLFVGDLAAALAYYTSRLGFGVVFQWGEPAYYAQIARDGARLNLRHVDEPAINPDRRDREQLLSASLTVASRAAIEALWREFEDAGVDFARPLQQQAWGAADFIVRDPDGNLLLFAGPSE
jgi:catechol 2,3-dioxygenase-like lactoylglutathione lyase family enzyme